MFKLLQVARAEIAYHTQYWTFYLVTFGMPLIVASLGAIPRLQLVAEQTPLSQVETVFNLEEELTIPTGYVDYADIINHIPPETADTLQPFADETSAKQALIQGNINSYYVIAADYITGGTVTQYSNSPQLLTSTDLPFSRIIDDNLISQLDDPVLAQRLQNPITMVTQGPPRRVISFVSEEIDLSRLMTAGLLVGLFSYTVSTSGALMVRGLQREIKVRVMEILITSTSPSQFIGGKMVGLATLALCQASLSFIAVLWVYGNNPDGSGPAAIPLTVILRCIPYLVLGLTAYCGIVMSMAAVWPNPRESGMLLSLAQLMALAPLIGVLFIVPDLHSWLSILLSIFPPTATLLMSFRLLLTSVPIWQWLIGLLGLSLWAALTVSLSIHLFRARGLMTGQSVKPKVVLQALKQQLMSNV